MNELTEKEKIILDNFYMSDDAELIVAHVVHTRSSILDNDIKIRMQQLKSLQRIMIFFIAVWTIIMIYIAMDGFFNV